MTDPRAIHVRGLKRQERGLSIFLPIPPEISDHTVESLRPRNHFRSPRTIREEPSRFSLHHEVSGKGVDYVDSCSTRQYSLGGVKQFSW